MPQTVHVVDAQAVNGTVADELKGQPMRRLENLRQLDANRSEIVDVEEAPVIDLLRGDAPETEAVDLAIEQLVKRIEAAGIARACLRTPAWASIASTASGHSSQRRTSLRLTTSFSRARSSIFCGFCSVRSGRCSSAVMTLWNSARNLRRHVHGLRGAASAGFRIML